MDAPHTLLVAPEGGFPNSAFPALLYCSAFPADADAIEQAFADQGWSNAWRDGIFTYHHFHSAAHEVLGVAAGEVQVMLGGTSGQTALLRAGDALVIPAGVGHCNMGQSSNLLVIGAYPNGDDYDIRLGNPAELQAAKRAIAAARFPVRDPVPDATFLHALWKDRIP
jgi:uncharacterized protein YjlB